MSEGHPAGAGIHPDVRQAAEAMVHETEVIEPDQARHDEYQFFVDAYAETCPRVRDLVQAVTRKVHER
jgi:hypothetical protein